MNTYWQIVLIVVAGVVAFVVAATFEPKWIKEKVVNLRLTEWSSYHSHHGRHQLRPGMR